MKGNKATYEGKQTHAYKRSNEKEREIWRNLGWFQCVMNKEIS